MSEADYLQSNTDRRGQVIRQILLKYLDADQMDRFEACVLALVQKITELKELDQRVQLGEEQLVALNQCNAVSDSFS